MLSTYIGAVFLYWDTIAFGGAATVALWLLDRYAVRKMGRSIPSGVIVSATVAALVVAMYYAWKDQKIAAAAASAELVRLTQPNLQMTIDQASAVTVTEPAGNPGIAQLLIYGISIANLGAPSTCQDWFIDVQDQALAVEFTRTYVPPQGFRFRTAEGLAHLPQADLIDERVATEPIGTNSRAVGYLVVSHNDERLIDPLRRGREHSVRCTDILGNTIKAQLVSDGETRPLKVIPGLGLNMVPEEK